MGDAVSAADPAGTLLKLAVLLQVGVAPDRAWRFVADSGDPAARLVIAAVEAGAGLASAIAGAGRGDEGRSRAGAGRRRGGPAGRAVRAGRAGAKGAGATDAGATDAGATDAWHDVAAAWQVASTVGAPLADSLRHLAGALRDADEAADEVRVALAEPAATARLLAGLPLVAVALGAALGFDTFGTLFGTPLGIACLIAGVALMLAAARWSRALVLRARSESALPGHGAELLAIALSGGVSLDRAVAIAASTGRPVDPEVEAVLSLSRTAGVPAVELLRASAALARHRARVEGRLRAARLSTRLLLPLGVCTLPAFLLLGVAPMLLGVTSSLELSL